MYEVNCYNLKTKQRFTKIFWEYDDLMKFKNKCKYSKKIIITSIVDNERLYS